MRHTVEIKLVNQDDLTRVKDGTIKPEKVRQIIVKDALVDSGASRLSLPEPIIKQLGLDAVDKTRSQTANGIVERTVYSPVEFTVLGRTDSMRVTDLPDDCPVLVGHMVMEHLDLHLDMKETRTDLQSRTRR
ncbi:aspartyl protease family protein [Candidatus Poribacteria bacterium]|nr:aspartyl protease family protein [Candidatus Poribacteria bacterium]